MPGHKQQRNQRVVIPCRGQSDTGWALQRNLLTHAVWTLDDEFSEVVLFTALPFSLLKRRGTDRPIGQREMILTEPWRD